MIFKPPSLLPPRSFPPLASTLNAGAAVAFTSEQNAFVTSPRIGYASRPNGQLTAEVSHLLDLQPCWLLLGFAPTGKRRILTAHAKSRH
jgi:hypothetical protein